MTGGAEWNTKLNKEMHAHYARNAVCIEQGDLHTVCKLCAKHAMATYLGIIERPFAEVPLVARACSTLKRLDIQFCSRAALWRLFTCVIEKNALEVLIVRSDDRRIQLGYLVGVKAQHFVWIL